MFARRTDDATVVIEDSKTKQMEVGKPRSLVAVFRTDMDNSHP